MAILRWKLWESAVWRFHLACADVPGSLKDSGAAMRQTVMPKHSPDSNACTHDQPKGLPVRH